MKQGFYERLTAYIIENQDKFYRLAYSYVKNQDDALDAVQNAVCKALAHYGDLKNEEALKTWLYRIVVNESLALLKARKQFVLADKGECSEIPYEEKQYEAYDDLYEQICRMEADTQNIIKLRFFEELELNEISQVLRMNLSTVKTKLYRGLRALRVSIEKEAGA